jgi:hypothetical protein
MFHPIEILNEWATRTNRFVRPRLDRLELAQLWHVAGQDAREASTWEAVLEPQASDTAKWMIVVTTYGRPSHAERLFVRLGVALRAAGVERQATLLVLHDACGGDYALARKTASSVAARLVWLDARERFGKARFWQIHQTALRIARAWQPVRALYLQDDVDFEENLIERIDAIWKATEEDPLRRVLYLFSSSEDEANGRWTHFPRRELPQAHCRLTNWFDLQAFVADAAFFALLQHAMVPIHRNRWRRRPTMSSGVGRQLTLRLRERAHIYQAWPPLVRHGGEASTMNPEARGVRSLDNREEYAREVSPDARARRER